MRNKENRSGSGDEAQYSGLAAPEKLEKLFAGTGDFSCRRVSTRGGVEVSLYFLDGLVSGQWVSEQILRPMMQSERLNAEPDAHRLIAALPSEINSHSCNERIGLDETVNDIVNCYVAVFAGGCSGCVTFEARGYAVRSPSEPSAENSHKGARDGFVENLRTNTALIRRRVKTPALRFEESAVGRQTRTAVSLVYIDGLTDPGLVAAVAEKLESIDEDGAVFAGSVEDYLSGAHSVFPMLLSTERADRACGSLLDGRVCLLIDGLPQCYIMPCTLSEFLRVPDDYASNPRFASAIGVLRYSALLLSVVLPSLYLSLICFHQEMLPNSLAVSIINSRRDVPFISFIELAGMLVIFEILLEAAVRMPNSIGMAVSIMGALVVGQAAVEAKIASPSVVIVIALCGIAGFTLPSPELAAAARVCRLGLTICAGIAGLYGLCLGSAFIIYRLCTLESFGVAYLSPLSVDNARDMAVYTAIRPDHDKIKWRPEMLNTLNKRRRR